MSTATVAGTPESRGYARDLYRGKLRTAGRARVVGVGAMDDEIITGTIPALRQITVPCSLWIAAEAALALYRARYPQAVPGDVFALVQTDWWMRLPAIRLADAHAGMARRTYMYEFAWPAGLGAVHALEIPFMLDTVGPDVPLFGPMLGPDAPQQLADVMHGAGVAFAGSGAPGPNWPRYDLDRRATMRFDVSSKAVPDPRAWEREVWAGIR